MKKFLAVLVVLMLTLVSSVVFAEVTVSGSVEIRNLATNNTADYNSKASDENRTTQERVRLAIDAKNENVKGRVQIENDWDVWGRFEQPQANGQTAPSAANSGLGRFELREAWLDFNMPFESIKGHVKVGHQFLQLGNAWFFRSMKYGSDAWLVGFPGKNTVAFVDVKLSEGRVAASDDTDAYTLLDVFKIDDNNTVGAYLVRLRDPNGVFFQGATGTPFSMGQEANLNNIGIHYNGKVGSLNLFAEADFQSGSYDVAPGTSIDFSGNQVILQANMPIDALTINATLASGSGDKAGTATKVEKIITALDADPHYTFVYEYFVKTACAAKNTGFCNTQAANLGVAYKVNANVTVGLDYWMLKANEKVNVNKGAVSDDIGSEVDAKILVKINDNLSWNWQLGRLMAGKVYDGATKTADDVDAVQGVLSYKF